MPCSERLDIALREGAGGRIERRQSTWWEVVVIGASGDERFRIHMRHKLQVGFAGPVFQGGGVFDQHPLLSDYREPWLELFVSGATAQAGLLVGEIERLVVEWSEGWRAAAEYLNPGFPAWRMLADGHGMLMAAPTTLIDRVASALEDRGVQHSLLPSRFGLRPCRVIVLGRSYLIAEELRVESPPGLT